MGDGDALSVGVSKTAFGRLVGAGVAVTTTTTGVGNSVAVTINGVCVGSRVFVEVRVGNVVGAVVEVGTLAVSVPHTDSAAWV